MSVTAAGIDAVPPVPLVSGSHGTGKAAPRGQAGSGMLWLAPQLASVSSLHRKNLRFLLFLSLIHYFLKVDTFLMPFLGWEVSKERESTADAVPKR